MDKIKFYNRENELNLLERVKKPFFAIIYGRRRVGKTTLALKFCENKDFLYFFVNPKKSEAQLIDEYFNLLRVKLNLEEYIRPKNWEEFFNILFERYGGVVIFDEFQWFLEINPQVPFILQKYLDVKKKLTVIILGSVVGMMKKLFAEEASPLFKRADVVIKLEPFDFKTVFKILDEVGIKDMEEKLKFYMVFGGIPHYYSLISAYGIKNFSDAIKSLILEINAPLKNEVEEIFRESFGKDYRTHFSILFAIGSGETKLEKISSLSSIKQTSIMPYIYDLKDLVEVIEERKYFGKKKKYYVLKDNFFKFWFRYIYKNWGLLTIDWRKVFEEIENDMNNYFGLLFEDFAREFLMELLRAGKFSFTKIEKFVGYFRENGKRKKFEIDIACFDEKTDELTFFEVKWKEIKTEEAESILEEMKRATKFIEKRKAFGLIAKKVENKEKLRSEGYKIFDLEDFNL
jgi:AAA+ ATPase superfamily predicted ATPase